MKEKLPQPLGHAVHHPNSQPPKTSFPWAPLELQPPQTPSLGAHSACPSQVGSPIRLHGHQGGDSQNVCHQTTFLPRRDLTGTPNKQKRGAHWPEFVS